MEFCKKKRLERFSDRKKISELNVAFSRVLCHGLVMLAGHLKKNSDPHLINNIILNRRGWGEHMELLWDNGFQIDTVSVQSALKSILDEVGLSAELDEWANMLIGKTSNKKYIPSLDSEASLAWLSIANSALNCSNTDKSPKIITAVEQWHTFLEKQVRLSGINQLHVYQKAVLFLTKFYKTTQQWQELIFISNKAEALFLDFESWMNVIEMMKIQSLAYSKLSDPIMALRYEDKILTTIPYNKAPTGLKNRQMMDILFSRLDRGAFEDAQGIVNELRSSTGTDQFTDYLDSSQCEIDFQLKRYEEALPYYCKLWKRCLEKNQLNELQELKNRFIDIEKELGQEYFQSLLREILPQGIAAPKEHSIALN